MFRRETKEAATPNLTPVATVPVSTTIAMPDAARQRSEPAPAAGPRHDAALPPDIDLSNDPLATRIKNGTLGFVGDVLRVNGEIHFKSMLRIDGKFSGRINSDDGTLILSSGAEISDAVIDVAVATIHGTINGDITARERIVLGRSADITGAIATAALVIEEGAIFNGSCRKI